VHNYNYSSAWGFGFLKFEVRSWEKKGKNRRQCVAKCLSSKNMALKVPPTRPLAAFPKSIILISSRGEEDKLTDAAYCIYPPPFPLPPFSCDSILSTSPEYIFRQLYESGLISDLGCRSSIHRHPLCFWRMVYYQTYIGLVEPIAQCPHCRDAEWTCLDTVLFYYTALGKVARCL
jgi:hypothetical protein